MTTYDFAQLEQLWVNAGGSPSLEKLMAGTAEVESGGNSKAYNPSGASGLWQIEVPLHDNIIPGGAADVFDPIDNAIAAVRLSGNTAQGIQNNWTDFEPPGAAAAIAAQNANVAPSATGTPKSSSEASNVANTGNGANESATTASFNPLNPGSWIPSILSGLGVTSDITDILERGALMVMGAILVIIGIVRMTEGGSSKSSDSSNAQNAASAAPTATSETAEVAEVAAA